MLTGSSSCTCSVEASCDSNVKLTAIDLRLGTSTTCGQSISVVDGASTHVFDCSHNNDYLPTVLLTSTSHFVQIKIEDNLGVEGGYYFILLEGNLTIIRGILALYSQTCISDHLYEAITCIM